MVTQQENPLVSIVVRTQNRPGFLFEALESLLHQTYRPLEVVVINDSRETLTNLEFLKTGNDFEVRIVNFSTPRGRAAAANAGVQVVRGTYLGFLDDDDIFYSQHVSRTVAFLESNPSLVAVYTDLYAATQEQDSTSPSGYKTIARDLRYCRSFDRELLFLDNYMPINAVIFRRSCLDKTGFFDENIEVLEDWEFWIRMALEFDFAHLCEVTGEFRLRQDRSSSTYKLQSLFPATRKYVYRKHAERTIPLLLDRLLRNGKQGPIPINNNSKEKASSSDHIPQLEHELAETRRQLAMVTTRLRRYLNSRLLKVPRAIRRILLRLPPPPPDP